MSVVGIDPGPERSAWALLGPEGVQAAHEANADVLSLVREWNPKEVHLAVEMIASYGMPVGREVFETCVWIGRYVEAWASRGGGHSLVYRMDVKMHLCGSSRAKDANVRQALLDRYGPGKAKAIGTKRAPGPLYGLAGDMWAALGVAVTSCSDARWSVAGGSQAM